MIKIWKEHRCLTIALAGIEIRFQYKPGRHIKPYTINNWEMGEWVHWRGPFTVAIWRT